MYMQILVKQVKNVHSTLFHKYLLVTNTCICGFGSLISDVTAQNLEHLVDRSKNEMQIDWKRTLRFSGIAFTLGPAVHFWYRWLDKIVPGTQLKTVVFKSFIDGFSFSPAYITAFYVIQKFIDPKERGESMIGLNANGVKYWVIETLLASPLQIANFKFVSLRYRVIYDNCVSYWFDTVFAYFFNKEVD